MLVKLSGGLSGRCRRWEATGGLEYGGVVRWRCASCVVEVMGSWRHIDGGKVGIGQVGDGFSHGTQVIGAIHPTHW
jgi:hypothetical protein